MINQTNFLCQLIEQNSEHQQKITVEELTHFLNRSAFSELLGREWQQGLRHEQSLSVILAHTNLRACSDVHCSIAAEHYLRQVFQAIYRVVYRSSDLISRCGSEEFGIILPNTSVESAIHMAIRIQNALKNVLQDYNAIAANKPITMRYGLSGLVPSPATNPVQLLKAADAALCQAESEGINRISVHYLKGVSSLPMA